MKRKLLLIAAALLFSGFETFSQYCSLQELSLPVRISSASFIIEGRILESSSFIDRDRSNIYTSHRVEVYKVFKGEVPGHFIEVITEGGTVGGATEYLTNTLSLHPGETGIFFCHTSSISSSPLGTDSGIRAEVFGSRQGFIRFDEDLSAAGDPFHRYADIEQDVRREIAGHLGAPYRVVRDLPSAGSERSGKHSSTIAATPSISSFSPTSTSAGSDEILTVNGNNFGAVRGTGRVEFKNADDGGSTWIYPLSSAYVSWSNTQIQVRIPTEAGTGPIRVRNSDPATGTSAGTLTIEWAWLNTTIGSVDYRTDFINDNSAGGYTWQMYTGFVTNTPAVEAFKRAFENWRCNTNVNAGPNWEIGPATSVNSIADDNVNVIRFDVGNELPVGVLGRTTLRWNNQNCPPMNVYCREIDMVFDSGTNWNFSTGNPSGGQIDFETVSLHELGHAMLLGHIINSSGVMHYSVSSGTAKRTLASNDIAGADAVLTQSIATNACGPSAMTQLNATISSGVHICAGGNATLLARGGSSYSWTPATGLSDPSIPNPVASPSRTTVYTASITNGTCYTASRDVTVSVPSVDAGPDANLCPGGSTQIGGAGVDGSPPYTYSWSPTAGLSNPSIPTPTASPTVTTTYILTVTDASPCTFRDTVVVTVSTLASDAGSDGSICPGGSVMLNGSASGGFAPYTYAWTPTTGLSDPTIAQPAASPNVTTLYALTVTDAGGCSATDSARVTVLPLPIADAGPDKLICSGASTQIGSAPDPQNSYAWFPITGLNNAGIANPIASPSVTTAYIVTVTSPAGCSKQDTMLVTIYQSNSNDYTWTGATSTDWNTVGNWDNPCALPQNGNNVTIPPATAPPINNPAIRLNRLIVNNTSGLSLSSGIIIDSLVQLLAGKIFLGDHDLRIEPAGSISGASTGRYIVTNGAGALMQLGIGAGQRDSSVVFPVGANAIRYTPLTVRNTAYPTGFSVKVKDQVLAGATSGTPITTHVVGKTWFVSDQGGGATAKLTFAWTANDELSSFDRSRSYIARHTGMLWAATQAAGGASGSNPYERSLDNCDVFGAFAIGDGSSPLPIELRSFSAQALADGNLLEWETGAEQGNYGFEIQRSILSDEAWASIGFVQGRGNASEVSRYRYLDPAPPVTRIYYRLIQIDHDGSRHASDAVSVFRQTPAADALGIHPNPVHRNGHGRILLTVPSGMSGPGELTVVNALGQHVFQVSSPGTSGTHSLEIPTGSFTPGIYFVLLRSRELHARTSFIVLE